MITAIKGFFTTYALYLLAGALAAVFAFAGLQTLRLAWARAAVATAEAKYASLEAAMTAATAQAEAAARTIEREQHEQQRLIDAAYAKGQSDAEESASRTVDALNAGALRLRREWAGCETSRLSAAAATAASADESARLQRESAGRIVRAVDECEAQVIGLQKSYEICVATCTRR